MCFTTFTLFSAKRAFYNDVLGEYSKFMSQYFGFDRVLPMNTRVEAVESACKIARRWGYEIKNIPENQARVCVLCTFQDKLLLMGFI